MKIIPACGPSEERGLKNSLHFQFGLFLHLNEHEDMMYQNKKSDPCSYDGQNPKGLE